MFLPENQLTKAELEEAKRMEILHSTMVEDLVKQRIPTSALESLESINVSEVQCGDPECAPIDTVIVVQFKSGGKGMLGIPCEMKEVDDEFLDEFFPPPEVVMDWAAGIDNQWHPGMADEETEINDYLEQYKSEVKLRFQIGQEVECRVGSDPVTGWAPGKVIELYYRESNWPANSLAPYKIGLDDGRNIFAPSDENQVIRKRLNYPAKLTKPVLPPATTEQPV